MAVWEGVDFAQQLYRCTAVLEDTSYLEIFSYTDPTLNSNEEHPLNVDDLDNFIHRRSGFSPPIVPEGVKLVAGIRLILQQNAKHPETFTPFVISLKHEVYLSMIQAWHLTPRVIESSSCVGPFFWANLDEGDDGPCLQVIYRKADVRKQGFTRGWEMSLSHNMKNGITTGYCKGTPSSDLVDCIKWLKAGASDIQHPILLPVLIFSQEISSKSDIKQRDARAWLRQLEHAVSLLIRTNNLENNAYGREEPGALDNINMDLVECHSQVLWKRPVAYIKILESIREAMEIFIRELPRERRGPNIEKLHRTMISRLEFYRIKLQGIDSYAATTLQRLEIQRSLVFNLISQRDSNLSFQIAAEQKQIAWASKRDSSAMKTISILGIVFLPGTYIASIFSTTFFNFQSSSEITSSVSPNFWLYWAVTAPVTLLILGIWFIWERRSAKKNAIFGLEDDAAKSTQ